MQDAEVIITTIVALVAASLLGLGVHLTRLHNTRLAYIKKQKSALERLSIDEQLGEIKTQTDAINSKINSGQVIHKQLEGFLEEAKLKTDKINVGLIPPTFSFDDSETLKSAILACRDDQYKCIDNYDATDSRSNWEWFGSKSDGAKMVADYRTLLIKAFNAEFEVIRKAMRVNTGKAAIDKLVKLDGKLQNLGETTNVSISPLYFNLKVKELGVWNKELIAKDKLKAQRKAQQAKLRAQNKAGSDDTDELDEEIAARESELAKAQSKAEQLAGEELAKLELLIDKIKAEKAALEAKFNRATSQAQITRAGYIYVISNHGCFGEGVVKIGMTRRLEPMDRVNELGDASVPFRFDVHTIAFVEDAPKTETMLHTKFSQLRVNTQNHRKEFFRVSPDKVKEEMDKIGVVSEWYFDVDAKEFNESNLIRNAIHNASKVTTTAQMLPESI